MEDLEELIECLLTVDGQGFNVKKEALISLLKREPKEIKEIIDVIEKYRRNKK